tara:strand:+ start:1116 stop:1880 length:765 start_codon:yes stop_codon:yes gene_type:complete
LKKFGLIGKTLEHSFSKDFFNQKFEKEKILASYHNFEIDKITSLKSIFSKNDIFGINVTVPYKEQVISQLDELDDVAKKIGAVNTILPTYNKRKLTSLKGYNTDAFGFHQLIKPYLKNHHTNALVLGSGGASKAIIHILNFYNIDYNIISRKDMPDNPIYFKWSDINYYMIKHHPLIINTTPIGMYPNTDQEFEFPYQYISGKHLVIDLIYNPKLTNFLRKSSLQKAQILNGYQMLVHQAIKAWNIWNSSINNK